MARTPTPQRSERVERAADDPRPAETPIIIPDSGKNGGGYAYHEPHPDDPGEPACNSGHPKTDFEESTLKEAKQKWMSPCNHLACRRERGDL